MNLCNQEWQEKLSVAERMHKFELEQLRKLLVLQFLHHTYICHHFQVCPPHLLSQPPQQDRERERTALEREKNKHIPPDRPSESGAPNQDLQPPMEVETKKSDPPKPKKEKGSPATETPKTKQAKKQTKKEAKKEAKSPSEASKAQIAKIEAELTKILKDSANDDMSYAGRQYCSRVHCCIHTFSAGRPLVSRA